MSKKAKNKINISAIINSIILLTLIIGVSVFAIRFITNNKSDENKAVQTSNKIKKEPEEYKLSITVGGDVLIHDTVFKSVKNGDTYDFTPIFKDVKDIFNKADLSVVNLEVPVASNKYAPSNYPTFNSPVQLLDAIKDMGVDIVSTANNHALDKGFVGLEATIQNANERGLTVIGTTNKDEEQMPYIVEKNNIKIGMASFTYGTNGIAIPAKHPDCVNIIDEEKMLKDIEYLKQNNVDFITFVLHFGQEYQLTPNKVQTKLVDFLIENGVDVIFGSHPHVPQPYELREVTLADGTKKQAFVVYSLGNFVSHQTDYYTKIGGIATINLSKKGEVKKIDSCKVDPIYTFVKREKGKYNFRVVPLEYTITESDKGNLNGFTLREIDKFKKIFEDGKKVYNKSLDNKEVK